MRPTAPSRVPSDSDEVGLIIALLVRYPQIATIVSHPVPGTLVLSFAVGRRLTRTVERELRQTVGEHVRALLDVRRERPRTLTVAVEPDEAMSFVRITRDAASFGRDELQLLVALLSERFGAALVQSPPGDEEALEDDESGADELVDYALEALRDPDQPRSLVGFREEKRVLVYYVKTRKKAKARARS